MVVMAASITATLSTGRSLSRLNQFLLLLLMLLFISLETGLGLSTNMYKIQPHDRSGKERIMNLSLRSGINRD